MSKIIIEFDSLEESEEARAAIDGVKWKAAIWDLDQLLRSITKYGSFEGHESTDAERDMADVLRESIKDILHSYQLNL